jgi:carbon storage regulator
MLVLERAQGQSIMIGDNITITIGTFDMRKPTVKVGISAPKWMPVHREEVYIQLKGDKGDGNHEYKKRK